MGTQSLSLKWNSHQRNLVDVFEQLLWNEDLVDVTLACEGVTLKAHKTLLSACSPFFHTLFLEHPCKHPVIIMKDVKYADLKCIIEFMYKGEIIVPQERLSDFLKTAETLKVKGLTENPSHQSKEFVQESTVSEPHATSQMSYAVTDETHLEHNSSSQKKRKRIRGRRGSLNDLSDDEYQSNSKDARYHAVADSGKTIIECNSSDVSQERISVPQSLHDDAIPIPKELPATFEEPLIDAPSSIDISNILDSHLRKENVQMLPSAELLSPDIGPPNSELLNPSSSAICTLDAGTSNSMSLPQELQKGINPVSLMTFQDPTISYEAGPSHRDKSLALSCIKIESSSNSYAECEQSTEDEPSKEFYPSATRSTNSINHAFMDKSTEVIQTSYSKTDSWSYCKQSRTFKVNQNSSFISKKALRKGADRIHTCAICHKTFDYKCRLMLHLRAHSNERPFSCDKCDKTFKRRSHYKSHQRLHHGVI